MPAKTMLDSYQEAIIPLKSDKALRDKYVNFVNLVRYGRIMEDLDTMAGEKVSLHFTIQELFLSSFHVSSL